MKSRQFTFALKFTSEENPNSPTQVMLFSKTYNKKGHKKGRKIITTWNTENVSKECDPGVLTEMLNKVIEDFFNLGKDKDEELNEAADEELNEAADEDYVEINDEEEIVIGGGVFVNDPDNDEECILLSEKQYEEYQKIESKEQLEMFFKNVEKSKPQPNAVEAEYPLSSDYKTSE